MLIHNQRGNMFSKFIFGAGNRICICIYKQSFYKKNDLTLVQNYINLNARRHLPTGWMFYSKIQEFGWSIRLPILLAVCINDLCLLVHTCAVCINNCDIMVITLVNSRCNSYIGITFLYINIHLLRGAKRAPASLPLYMCTPGFWLPSSAVLL